MNAPRLHCFRAFLRKKQCGQKTLFFAKNRVFFTIFTKILTNFYKIYEIYKILCKKNLIFFRNFTKKWSIYVTLLTEISEKWYIFRKKIFRNFYKILKNFTKKCLIYTALLTEISEKWYIFHKKIFRNFYKILKKFTKKYLSEKNKKFLKNCNFLKIFIFSYTFYTPDINVFFFIKYNKNIYKKCINFTIFFRIYKFL